MTLVIDHIPFDLEAEIQAVRNTNVILDRAVVKEVEASKQREEEELARGVAAVAEMRMGGVL